MKLSDMPTPETDACAKRCRDNLPFALAESIGDVVTVAHARMLEQRLGLVVAALKECYSNEAQVERRKCERRVKQARQYFTAMGNERSGNDRRKT